MGLDITGLGSVFDFGSKVIDKLFPDKTEAEKIKIQLAEMQQKGELAAMEYEFKLAQGQQNINVEEAKSPNLFVSGWRPAVGWTGVAGLNYQFIVNPLLVWASNNFNWIAPPVISTDTLIQLVFALLGVSGMRTYEKYKGVAK